MTRKPPSLDALIASAGVDEPSEEALARLEHKLSGLASGAGAAGAGAAGKAGAAAGKAAMAASTKWLIGAVIVVAIAGAIAVVRREVPAEQAPVSPSSTVRAVDAGASDVDALDMAPIDVPADVPADAAPIDAPADAPADAMLASAPRPAVAPIARAAATPSPSPLPADALAAEASLLAAAQTALRDGDATRALAVAETHRARYPRGVLVEERERLAIEALLRLGRRDAAVLRARDFDRRFPDSIQSARLHDLLERAH